MIAELVLSYVALGVTYIAMQAYQGAGAFLGRKLAEDARAVPPALLPLLGFIVALISIVVMALLLAWRHRENIQRLIAGTESRLGSKKAKPVEGEESAKAKPKAKAKAKH